MRVEQPKAGLIAKDGAVPLEGVRVDATLRGTCLDVLVTQRYRNTERVPVEAVYVFPMEEGAAVCGFAARAGDSIVRGQVEEREKAFATYDDAMIAGHGAFLLDQERPDVFTASVGNLRPGEAVELQIRYVSMARREGDAIRVSIPTTVSPRYVPAASAPEIGQPDGERVTPESWPNVPYGLALSLDVELGFTYRERVALARVESPSHPIRTTLREGGARIELAQEENALDRDVVVFIEPQPRAQPMAMFARDEDGTRVAMITFLPDIAERDEGHEVVFLLDCSGSMQGDSIAQAKRALQLCVRALGPKDRFDIVCFGGSSHAFWGSSRVFDERSLDEASKRIGAIDANLGGTEILAPLRAILERPSASGLARRVLLLTDGQVSNEADVIALAKQHGDRARVFAFGIGAGASEHLVRGVARASRGAAEMIAPGERIEPKVMRTFARVRTPSFDDVRVDWGSLRVEQAPQRTPPVFAGDALTVLARIEGGSADEVMLMAGSHRWTVAIDLEHASLGGPIPVLWARERIRELEDGAGGSAQRRAEREERKRRELIELGEKYGLVSSATSYVAVEERPLDARTTAPAELRRIPVALTSGWGGGRMELAPPPAPRAMAAMPAPAAPALSMHRASSSSTPKGGGFFSRVSQVLFGGGTNKEPESAVVAPTDRVFDLLMTQKADGRFERSKELDAWLGVRVAKLESAIHTHGDAVVCTAVVIALLEAEASERESEWRPAVTKAKAWLVGKPEVDATVLVRG
jgi:Ca-activated chloride channel family protein